MNINKIQSTRRVATIWLSGVTASGKTTLGKLLFQGLKDYGIEKVKFLDGEDLRKRLTENLGHSLDERFIIIEKWIGIAKKENNNGFTVIISTVSHKQKMRDLVRKQIDNFMEVNLICSPKTCASRDYKNIYNRINANSNECFPGITEPYEISDQAELILDTEKNSIEDSRIILLNKTLEFLNENISQGSLRKKKVK